MSNLILLLHSDADVAQIADTAHRIIHHGYKGCWILVSPALASNQTSVAEKYDKEIADMQAAEEAAAKRGDYNAASELQLSKRGKIMDRDKAIADNWKAIPEADRMPTIRQKLAPLMSVFPGKIDAKVTITQDHYDPSNWVQLLNSLSGAWFAPMKIGSFSVAWPAAIPAIIKNRIPIVQEIKSESAMKAVANIPETPKVIVPSPIPVVTPPAKKKPEKRQPEAAATTPDARKKQLEGMRFFALTGTAKRLKLDPKGKRGPQIIEEILAKEFQAVA